VATRDMEMDERIVTDAELDEWAAKLKATKGRYRKGRVVMEQFIPFLSERLEAATRRLLAVHRGRNPLQN
jgi:hypothetical protein